MGNFSRNTYSILKNPDAAGFVRDYRGVRLQMGVPLVDADWNELEDIRKNELRDLVRAVIGTGVPATPANNNGFAITVVSAQAGQVPSLKITDGTMIVNGTLVTNGGAINYSAQEYYAGDPQALKRATDRGVTPVAVLTALPAAGGGTQTRKDTVYLESWEREVGSAEDNRMMDNALLEETSTRLRLEWAVRVAQNGAAVPASTGTVIRTPLAEITYTVPNNGPVTYTIKERRRRGLTLESLVDQDRIMSVAPVAVPRYNWFNLINPWSFTGDALYAVVPWGSSDAQGGADIPVNMAHGARITDLRIIGMKLGGSLQVNFRAVSLAAPFTEIELTPPQSWNNSTNLNPLDVNLAASPVHVVDTTQYKYVLSVYAAVHRASFWAADTIVISAFQIKYRY